MTFELRIEDRWGHNTRILVPFHLFLTSLLKVFPELGQFRWRIFRGAEGYGLKVCSIEAALDQDDPIIIDAASLLPELLSGDEYFNHARISVEDQNVEFGIFDSTYYFVRSDDCAELQRLAQGFEHAYIVSCS